jgi:hypothetical protein
MEVGVLAKAGPAQLAEQITHDRGPGAQLTGVLAEGAQGKSGDLHFQDRAAGRPAGRGAVGPGLGDPAVQ